MDYKQLNELTMKNKFLISLIDDFLDDLYGVELKVRLLPSKDVYC